MYKYKIIFLLTFLYYFSLISRPYAQAVGDGIRIDLSERLSLNTDGGQFAQLFIPDFYEASSDSEYTFVFHLHSASWAAENQVYHAQASIIIFYNRIMLIFPVNVYT